MKIGIDCRMLSPGFGLGRYVQQLVKHLQAIDTKNQYILFLKADNWKEVEESENFKKVLTDIPWYSWQEQTKLKKIIKKENVDLMHFPHWNVPLSYHDPFVVTIHDLIMYHFPRPQATTRSRIVFWLKDKIHRMVIRHAVEKASRVIATSEFTKGDVVKTLHIAESKITVVYQAPFVDDAYRASPITYHDIQKKYSITEPYVLYVGAAYPHKNLERLVDAWKLFEEKYGENYQLVLVGKEDYFYKRLKSGIKAGESKIIFTGFASDDELVELYKHASLYVFPSLYEGFGLPPLEAMSYGVPVVSSHASCLPEVLGDAAVYFDPQSIENICYTIQRVLEDKDIQTMLLQNGRERIKELSNIRGASSTLDIYRSCI